jgi:hypothetical protein
MAVIPGFTELECVNKMLLLLGEAPVVTLDDLTFAEASLARQVLQEDSVSIQQQGFYWNTLNLTLQPDISGYIYLPEGTLRMDPVDKASYYIKRGNRLYDGENNTYVIAEDVEVELIQFLSWDEVPEVVRHYITIKAARRFLTRMNPDRLKIGYTEREELDAKAAIMADEVAHNNPTIFDNWASADKLNRGTNPVRRRYY